MGKLIFSKGDFSISRGAAWLILNSLFSSRFSYWLKMEATGARVSTKTSVEQITFFESEISSRHCEFWGHFNFQLTQNMYMRCFTL